MATPSNLARCRLASTVGHCDKAALYGIFIPTISAIRRPRLEILLAGFDNWAGLIRAGHCIPLIAGERAPPPASVTERGLCRLDQHTSQHDRDRTAKTERERAIFLQMAEA